MDDAASWAGASDTDQIIFSVLSNADRVDLSRLPSVSLHDTLAASPRIQELPTIHEAPPESPPRAPIATPPPAPATTPGLDYGAPARPPSPPPVPATTPGLDYGAPARAPSPPRAPNGGGGVDYTAPCAPDDNTPARPVSPPSRPTEAPASGYGNPFSWFQTTSAEP